jgi:hypothetical protein
VPFPGVLLLGLESGIELSGAFVDFLEELGVDGGNFFIGDAIVFSLGIEDRVDV